MRVERIVELGKKLGADDVIATSVEENIKQVRFMNSKISVVKNYELKNVEVFLSIGKRIIFGTIKNYEEIKKLIKLAKMLEPRKDYYGIAKGKFLYSPVKKGYDEKLLNFDVVACVKDAISHCSTKRCSGNLYLSEWKIVKATNHEIFATDKGTSIEFSIRAFLDKYASGHSVACSRTLEDFDYLGAVEEATKLAKLARAPKKGKEGKYDVIFSPLAFANILNQVGDALSAFSVDAGFSCFGDKIGKKVASDIVTLYDDGRLENGLGSVAFDEEGVPTKKTTLIENGILKTYLHNTSTAKKHKTETTANAGLIYPSPWNLVLKEGDYDLDEMISQVKNGILITNVWYTRFTNYVTGDFSTIPRDAMIEIRNGELARPVVELRISDNILKLLSNVRGITKVSKQVKWWELQYPVKVGYVWVKNVHLSSPSNV